MPCQMLEQAGAGVGEKGKGECDALVHVWCCTCRSLLSRRLASTKNLKRKEAAATWRKSAMPPGTLGGSGRSLNTRARASSSTLAHQTLPCVYVRARVCACEDESQGLCALAVGLVSP